MIPIHADSGKGRVRRPIIFYVNVKPPAVFGEQFTTPDTVGMVLRSKEGDEIQQNPKTGG